MKRTLARALVIIGLVGAAPVSAFAGSVGVSVPNTAAARQWAPRHAPGRAPHHHHRAVAGTAVYVPSMMVVVVPQAVAPQPQWVEEGWRWDGWQWVWVPGYWAW